MMNTNIIDPDFSEQVTLFDNIDRKIFSRRIDSPTSAQAVKIPKIKGELKAVLHAVDQMLIGFTARELANHSGLDYVMVSKRLSVLQKYGYITKSDPRDPNPERRDGQMIWWRI